MSDQSPTETQNNAGVWRDNASDEAVSYFVVYQKYRIYGFDSQYADGHVWVNADGVCASAHEEERLAREYLAAHGVAPEGWTRRGYKDLSGFTAAFLTEEAAHTYMRDNRAHLNQPFVCTESLKHNPEMREARHLLLGGQSEKQALLQEAALALRNISEALEQGDIAGVQTAIETAQAVADQISNLLPAAKRQKPGA